MSHQGDSYHPDVLFFQGQLAQRQLTRKLQNRGTLIFPGIRSDDVKYLKLMEKLVDALNGAISSVIDPNGVSDHRACPGNFSGLRTVSGYRKLPRNLPPVDNELLREQLKLAKGFVGPDDAAIFEGVWKAMFTTRIPDKMRIARDSSTVFPYFVKDMEAKKQIFRTAKKNFNAIQELLKSGRLDAAAINHAFCVAYYLVERLQVDKMSFDPDTGRWTSKTRMVSPLDYALSGGRRGKMIPARDEVVVNGKRIEGHAAMRSRTAYGMAACVNYLITAVFSTLRNYLTRYAFTWKHTTPAAIRDKVKTFKHFVGFDVTQFDQSVGRWQIQFFIDQLREHWSEGFVDMVSMAFHAPYFTPPTDIQGARARWVGDPLNKNDFTMNYGLPSGIACNPDFGKWLCTSVYLCLINDYTKDVLRVGIPTFLEGKHPNFAILNMGDDNVILTNDDGFFDWTRARGAKGEPLSPYLAIEPEKAISFLGNVFYRDLAGTIQLAPNIISFFDKWFCPERGIDSKMRAFWPVGWEERKLHYASAPSWSDAHEILERLFRDTYGVSPSKFSRERLGEFPNLRSPSALDRIVLDDPSKLYYRVDPNDISPELLDSIVGTIDADEVEEFCEMVAR